jgi:Holliday junction resolvase-like predicted endonuclease
MFQKLKELLFVSHVAEPLGRWGERVAQDEYKRSGYKIIRQNEFNRRGKQVGEIDFIALGKGSIAFVEVKTRMMGGSRFGSGFEAIHQLKQQRLLRAVKMFLNKYPKYQKLQPRIDACLVETNKVDRAQKRVTILSNVVSDLY